MRTAARTDSNQSELVSRLRTIPGCKVFVTSALGGGFPDLTVLWMDNVYLLEVKDGDKPPSKRKLTSDEKKFHRQWESSKVAVVTSIEDCLHVLDISIEEPPF